LGFSEIFFFSSILSLSSSGFALAIQNIKVSRHLFFVFNLVLIFLLLFILFIVFFLFFFFNFINHHLFLFNFDIKFEHYFFNCCLFFNPFLNWILFSISSLNI
jgi:hypothetical protein